RFARLPWDWLGAGSRRPSRSAARFTRCRGIKILGVPIPPCLNRARAVGLGGHRRRARGALVLVPRARPCARRSEAPDLAGDAARPGGRAGWLGGAARPALAGLVRLSPRAGPRRRGGDRRLPLHDAVLRR